MLNANISLTELHLTRPITPIVAMPPAVKSQFRGLTMSLWRWRKPSLTPRDPVASRVYFVRHVWREFFKRANRADRSGIRTLLIA